MLALVRLSDDIMLLCFKTSGMQLDLDLLLTYDQNCFVMALQSLDSNRLSLILLFIILLLNYLLQFTNFNL